MKKKMMAYLLTLLMATALMTTGCGDSNTEADKKTETAADATTDSADTEDKSEDEKADQTEDAADSDKTEEAEDTIENYAGLADELAALVTDDDISQVDAAVAEATYGIDPEQVADCKVLLSSGATASEVAVFSMKDEAGADELVELMNERVQDRTESFADYAADEVPKLEKAIITKKGNVVVMAVVSDADAAQAVIDKY